MKNRILFINPPQSGNAKLRYNSLKFPLGFIYMSEVLEENGFEVKILDCPLYYRKKKQISKNTVKFGSYTSEIEEVINRFKPNIIGVSCAYTAYESDSFDIIELIKKKFKEILIIVGGAHSSANPEHVLRNKNIDLVVIGEGEDTMLEIAMRYRSKKKLQNIKGTAIRVKGKIVVNERREPIQDLDQLKPAYHLINLPSYFSHPDNSISTMRSPSVDIITSRGCPGNCVFCSIRTVWGRKWRGRSAKNVVDELELMYKKYNVRQFRIQDDNLTLDRSRIIEICNEIIKRKLDIRWDTPNGVAFWTLDKEVLTQMKKAGCYRITLGIESCSPITQKYIKKMVDLKKVDNLIDTCHKLGIWVCATFIIGFPYETKEDIKLTRDYIIHSGINFAFLYVAQPYQGTDLYIDFKKEGLIKSFEYDSTVFKSRYNTKHFTNKELNLIRTKILKRFYLNKAISYCNPINFYKEFVSKIRTQEDFYYVLKNFYNFFIDASSYLF